MEKVIGPAVALFVSLCALAVAWGRLMSKTERNVEDIKTMASNCKEYREHCQLEICTKIDKIFDKLDSMQSTTNNSITTLSVHMARLEEKIGRQIP